MKKIYKLLAVAFTFALIVASPVATITSHALGLNIDSPENTTDRGAMPDNYWDNSSSSEPAPSYSEPAPSYSEPAPSYNEPTISYSGFNANAPTNNADNGSMPSNYYETKKNSNDVIVRVAGGQTFRNVMNTDHTSYQVYHCGNSIVTFTVTDDKDNVVEFKTVTLEQGEDKLWYENITFAEGVDVKDFTVNVTKGDATYLSTELGVSGIKINGTVVLSTVPAEPEKESVVGHRYCATCGASFDIYENSGVDGAWKTHMKEHLAKGEPARYSDK